MALSRTERNQQIEHTLADLASLRGVTTAALVDSDGFVTHIRKDFEIDTDALGAAVQIVYAATHRAAEQVAHDATKLILSENKGGVMILGPLIRGFVLTLVADESAMLGTMRFELKETIPVLNELLGS
jgi:hypothetical protein